jgi:hypothetical protein
MRSFILSLVLCASMFAQTDSARLAGTVTDSSGGVIHGAVVRVVNEKTGAVREVLSGETGTFLVVNLAPAPYSVSVSKEGLAAAEYRDVPLAVGQERSLSIVLQPASTQQTINVSGGDLAIIDTSSARVGNNINEREVAQMPINGRQISQLYLLTPGATTAGGGSFDNIRFSGRANQENAIRFDGIEASSIIDASPGNLNGEVSTGFRLQASLENIQEFRIESSNYPAEFGTGSSAQISVVTKSGSNAFHGSTFEYLRNDAVDARNFFDGSAKSSLRLNQYGGSLGGPIKKDKLFFFGSFEGLAQRNGVPLVAAVPSLAARSRAVAAVKPLMDAYPVGTPTSDANLNLAQVNASQSIDEYSGNARFDYNLSSKLVLTGRYSRDQGYLEQPQDVTGRVQRVTAVAQNALLNLQQIIGPALLNETKIGFNGPKTRLNGVSPIVNGINTSDFSIDFTGQAFISGIGGQGVSGGAARLGGIIRANSAQNGRAQPYTNNSFSFIDNLSWLKGRHNFKFGGEVRPITLYTDRLGGTTYTFASLDAYLNNSPSSVQILGDVSAPNPLHGGATGNRHLSQNYYIAYAQDEFKLRPNLTVNYGLRWEYYSVMHEERNLYTLFQVERGGLAPAGTPWYSSSKLNFAPRLGISWSPERFKNKTVFRVGAGYYYGPGQSEDQVQPIDSDRVTVSVPGGVFPVDSRSIIANFDANTVKGFQPRAYSQGYTLPEKILSYTASIQQQLPGNAVLTVAYVGSQGRDLFLRSWTNRLMGVRMNPTTGAAINVLEFGDKFAQIDYKTSGGTDHYESLQSSLQRRFSRGLTLGAQWTYGHSIGDTGGSNEAQTTQNPMNFSQDRGNNAFDIRHSMNATVLYELPFGQGRKYGSKANSLLKAVAGGWDVGGVFNARTGLPIDVTMSRPDVVYQLAGTSNYVTSPVISGGQIITTPVVNNPYGGAFRSNRRPNVVAGVDPFLHGDKRYILNPAAFSIPAPGTFGNLGRYALHGPGMNQFDLTVHKAFSIAEKAKLEFRAEIYNLLNRANLANPSAVLNFPLGTGAGQLQPNQAFLPTTAGLGVFGQARSTVENSVGLGAQRQAQFSLRLSF